MATSFRSLLLCLCLGLSLAAEADTQVFTLRGPNPEDVLETMRTALGDRAQVNMVQQKLVVVGDAKSIEEAAKLLRQIDRLPANLRLTLTETPPAATEDPDSGTRVYTSAQNSQTMETLEGALLSLDYTKFHQQVDTNGWLFTVHDAPVAVRQLEVRVRLVGPHTAQIMMTFTRHENQERRVYGRTAVGELGAWIPLLPQSTVTIADANAKEYSSGTKPGEQLYLKVEKVFLPRAIKAAP